MAMRCLIVVSSIMFLFAKRSWSLKGFLRPTARSSSVSALPEYVASSYKSNPQYMKYVSSDRLNIAVTASTEMTYKGDLLVIPFYRPADAKDIKDDKLYVAELKKSIPTGLPADVQTIVAELLDECFFKADVMTKSVMRVSHPSIRYIALVGLGPNPKKGDPIDLEISSAARLGKLVAGIAKDIKGAGEVGVVMPIGTNNGGITQFLLGMIDSTICIVRHFHNSSPPLTIHLLMHSLHHTLSLDSYIMLQGFMTILMSIIVSKKYPMRDLNHIH